MDWAIFAIFTATYEEHKEILIDVIDNLIIDIPISQNEKLPVLDTGRNLKLLVE